MCNVCAAQAALAPGGSVELWGLTDGRALHIEAKGDGPEGKPCEYRVRRMTARSGTRGKWGRWSKWQRTTDLAGVTGALGLDVKWEFVGLLTRQFLTGRVTPNEVVDRIRRREGEFAREIAADTTIYTSFLENGHVLFTTNALWPTVAPRWKAKRSAVIPPSGGDVILDDTVRFIVGLDGVRPLAYFAPDEEKP